MSEIVNVALFLVALTAASPVGGTPSCGPAFVPTDTLVGPPDLAIPESMRIEHRALHDRLRAAVGSGGETAVAAQSLVEIMRPHFREEEEYALPPLGLLPRLARGEIDPAMRAAIPLTEALAARLDRHVREHVEIGRALDVLADVARGEGKMEFVELAEEVRLHARNEEEILYPAAILVGEHLKLRLDTPPESGP